MKRGTRVFILKKALELLLTLFIVTMISFILIDSPSLCFFAASLTKNPSPTAAASVSMQMILLSGYSCCSSSTAKNAD